MTNRQPSRRERIVAMALQTESPAEAAVAQEKLRGDITILPRAQQALAEATTFAEMKDIETMAVAFRAGAKAHGMGIEAENMAADIIIRARRKMGQELVRMKDEGLLITSSDAGVRGAVARGLASQSSPSRGLTLVELGVASDPSRAGNLSSMYQRLAAIPDDVFEQMLDQERRATEGGQPKRLSQVDLVRAWYGTTPKTPTVNTTPTAEDSGFLMFRAGAYALLGWQVDDDGKGTATRNGLLELPSDELRQLARLVQALASAYGEARSARG